MTTNYKYNSLLNKDEKTEYFGQHIITKIIDGYIYRGDEHTTLVLSKSPKFYGTKESAMEYIVNGNYLKRYKTMKKLTLLNISAGNNVKNIIDFFMNFLLKHQKLQKMLLDVKISFIIIQALFGIVENNRIHKLDLNDNDITNYFKTKKISDVTTKLFLKIINHIIKKTVPSRCSIRSIDKLLMNNLMNILLFMKIDGVYYINTATGGNLLCKEVNKYYKKNVESCVPTEICIFNPGNNLGGVVMWKKTNSGLVFIDKVNKYNKYIKNNYNRLSLSDLHYLSRQYSR